METTSNEKIYAFDSLYTTNHIQILKILLPCFNPPLQKNLALYIKFLELRYTISFSGRYPYVIKGCGFDKLPVKWQFPWDELLPYLTPKEAEMWKQLQKSLEMMRQFSSMQKNLEALKDILPEGMDLEAFLQNMMHNGNMQDEKTGQEKQDISGGKTDGKSSAFSQAGGFFKDMMTGRDSSSTEDIFKKMMSPSQMELFEKFNDRFQNI